MAGDATLGVKARVDCHQESSDSVVEHVTRGCVVLQAVVDYAVAFWSWLWKLDVVPGWEFLEGVY